MSKIVVTELQDSHECETCGTSYATGYSITVDGRVMVDLQPVAACYDANHYTLADALMELVEQYGHTVEFAVEDTHE